MINLKLLTFLFLFAINGFCRTINDNDIVVSGDTDISKSLIASFFVGKEFDEDGVNQGMKDLYTSEYFENIDVDVGDKIRLHVVENLVVNDIILRNSSKITFDKVKDHLSLKKGRPFSKNKAKLDLRKIIETYQSMGYLSATGNLYIDKKQGKLVNVVFDMDIKEQDYINSVKFVGNNDISYWSLRAAVKSKPGLFLSNSFDFESLEHDKKSIAAFYGKKGYALAKVLRADVERDGNKINIKFFIEEGEKYKINDIVINDNINNEKLKKRVTGVVKGLKNEVFDKQDFDLAIYKVKDVYSSSGYAFAKVDHEFVKSSKKGFVDVVLSIENGDIFYIDKVVIRGNKSYSDRFVRAEVLVYPGEVFDNSKVEQSKSRLLRTGSFQDASFNIVRKDGNLVDVEIDVKEAANLNLSFMVGYSSFEGAIGQISYNKNGIFGSSKSAGFSLMKSGWRESYGVNYYDKHFLGTDLGLGFGIDVSRFGSYASSSFLSSSSLSKLSFLNDYGGAVYNFSVRTGYLINSELSHSFDVSVRSVETSIGGSTAQNNVIMAEQMSSKNVMLVLSHALTYDARDNGFLPTKGFLFSVRQFMSNFYGGEASFLGHEARFSFHKALFLDTIFNFSFQAGNLINLSDGFIPSNSRYNLGYHNLRGFRNYGAGPRVMYTDSSGNTSYYTSTITAKNYYSGTADWSFPITKGENQIRGSFFVDFGSAFGFDGAGSVTRSDGTKERVLDSASIRVAGGFGIVLYSPMGPIRFDFAKAIVKEVYDNDIIFMIRFGDAGL